MGNVAIGQAKLYEYLLDTYKTFFTILSRTQSRNGGSNPSFPAKEK